MRSKTESLLSKRLSFLNPFIFFSFLLLTNCTTLQNPGDVDPYLKNIASNQMYVHPWKMKDKKQNLMNSPEPFMSYVTKFKAEYCDGKRARKKVAHDIKVVVPKYTEGSIVTSANKQLSIYKSDVELFLSRWYRYVAINAFSEIYDHERDGSRLIGLNPKLSSTDDLIAIFKGTHFSDQAFAEGNYFSRLPDGSMEPSVSPFEGWNVLVIQDSIIVVPKYSTERLNPLVIKGDLDSGYELDYGEANLLNKIWRQPYHGEYFPIGFYPKGQDMFAVPVTFSEIAAMLTFTMLIPREVQRQLWPKDGPYFVGADGSFDVEAAVRAKNEIFKAYFDSQTSISEISSDDSQIMKFRVELDLNVFCTYARPISDFMSK